MKKFKEVLTEIFIDGLGGMATGLFATLIIGTIIAQIGTWISGINNPFWSFIGGMIFLIGKLLKNHDKGMAYYNVGIAFFSAMTWIILV